MGYCAVNSITIMSHAVSSRSTIKQVFIDMIQYFLRITFGSTCAFVLLCQASSAVAFEVSAQVDRTPIFLDESVNLIVTTSGEQQASGEPDLEPLRADFEILGKSVQTSINIANGRQQITQSWVIEIRPKHVLITEIPAITVDGISTQPIQFEVRDFSGNVQKAGADLFLEAEASPKNPYVQSQLTYIVRLFVAVNVPEGNLPDPQISFGLVQKLGQDRRYRAKRANRDYQVYERRYAVFPEQSGEFSIGQIEFHGIIERNNHHTRERISLDPIKVTVRPKPASFSGKTWLPAQGLRLIDSWSVNTPDFKAGQPEARQITVEATGLRAVQLSSPEYEDNGTTRIYSTNPQLDSKQIGDRIHGRRTEEFIIIPQNVDNVELPEFRVVWWDVDADRERIAVLPKIDIISTAGADEIGDAGSANETGTEIEDLQTQVREPDRKWQILSVGLLCVWLLTLFVWFSSVRVKRVRMDSIETEMNSRQASQREMLGKLRSACMRGDSRLASRYLIEWARLNWHSNPPLSLIALARRTTSERLKQEIGNLDRIKYSSEDSEWHGQSLWKLLRQEFSKSRGKKKKSPWLFLFKRKKNELDSLWPERGDLVN